jgi:acyl carrier protein
MSNLSREHVEQEIIDILIRHKPSREITPESSLVSDLGFDSVAVIELVGELEEHFDIAIPMNRLPEIRTVAQMTSNIHLLLTSQQPR